MKETPAYQSIDILLGKHVNDVSRPVRGWYIEIPDQAGRDAVRKIDVAYRFVYKEDEIHEKVKYAKSVSEYPDSVYAGKAWIHDEGNRLYRSPR